MVPKFVQKKHGIPLINTDYRQVLDIPQTSRSQDFLEANIHGWATLVADSYGAR